MRRNIPITVVLTLLLDACAPAEESDSSRVPNPPVREGPVATHRGAGPGHLGTRYGIDADEERMRIESQEHIGALNTSLHENPLPGFTAIWIQHEPTYAAVVVSKVPLDRQEVLRRAHPSIRRHIVFRPAKRDRFEVERDQERILQMLRAAPGGWSGGYDVTVDKFVFDFAGPPGLSYAERNLPADLKDDVIFRIGSVPMLLTR